MAGHSKWSKIKRAKAVTDKKRGKIFTRCIHEITVAVREGGGGDPDANPRLRLAMDKARSANMPNDNIDRAIRRATGEEKGAEQHELIYEGYGPGGVAVMVEVLTDNKNRTVSEVRHAFSKCGGSLGENGCVSWMFDKKGLVILSKANKDEAGLSDDDLFDLALEAGAEDISEEGDVWEITSGPADFHALQEALSAKVELDEAEIQHLPKSRTEVDGKQSAQVIRLLEMLDDLDDVLNVSANCDFSNAEGDS